MTALNTDFNEVKSSYHLSAPLRSKGVHCTYVISPVRVRVCVRISRARVLARERDQNVQFLH